MRWAIRRPEIRWALFVLLQHGRTRPPKEVPENRGGIFCMGAQICTDILPYISITPVFGYFFRGTSSSKHVFPSLLWCKMRCLPKFLVVSSTRPNPAHHMEKTDTGMNPLQPIRSICFQPPSVSQLTSPTSQTVSLNKTYESNPPL